MSHENIKVAIDCDNAAVEMKTVIVEHLKKQGFDVTDLKYSASHEKPFYPEIGCSLAHEIQNGSYDRGILI